MRYRVASFVAIALLAGCAGTPQATGEPAAQPVVAAEPAPGPIAEPRVTVAAVESGPLTAPTAAASEPAAAASNSPQPLDPLRYVMAWSKGVQDAMAPWAKAAEACDTRADKR